MFSDHYPALRVISMMFTSYTNNELIRARVGGEVSGANTEYPLGDSCSARLTKTTV